MNRHQFLNVLLSAISLSTTTVYAAASSNNVTTLDTMFVTATRTAISTNASLSPVSVITREDIERWQVTSVQDALQRTPGISIANSGGQGKVSSIFLRGTNSDHVLVLIDGQRVASATTASAAIEQLPIELIDRIEIVRGPRASLYGSEAIGGVIQIFTRQKTDAIKPYAIVGGGSDKTYRAAGGVSGSINNLSFSLNASHYHTNGFNACSGILNKAGCFDNEPDNDGYLRTAGSAQLGYTFNDFAKLEGNFLQTNGNTKFDGSFQNRGKTVNQVYGGKLTLTPTDQLDISISGGRSKDESDNFNNGKFTGSFVTRRVSTLTQVNYRVNDDHELTTGFEYWNDLVGGTTNYSEKSRDNKAGFFQYQGRYAAVDWLAGIRLDNNEQFGNNLTGDIAIGYRFDSGIKVIGSYGSAFKAPSFNELYFPDSQFFKSNPNLNPEKSQSVELQIRGSHYHIDWSVNGYWTWVNNLISTVQLDPADVTSPFTSANVSDARIRGLELTASTHLYGFEIAANVSLIDPTDRSSGATHGNVLPRRPERMFTFNLDRSLGNYRIGSFTLGTTVRGESRRFDNAFNSTRVGGFVTVDLRGEYRPHPDWVIQAKVGNLLDKKYEKVRYFNQDDRNFLFTLRYTPQGF
ncbi:MAG TPA: TonB-dependent receptor [Crenotrichaceae bacterium]|nr:TonB-dependent receptor [Crenotrichaceae bacterium]